MRNFTKSALLGVLCAGLSLVGGLETAHAQKPSPVASGKAKTGGKHDGNGMMKRLMAQLNLTPDQTTKLKAIEAKNKATVAGIEANKTLTADQKKTLVKAEGKTARADAAKMLTPAQQEKFKMLVMQAAMERKNKMAGAKGAVAGTSPAPKAIK